MNNSIIRAGVHSNLTTKSKDRKRNLNITGCS